MLFRQMLKKLKTVGVKGKCERAVQLGGGSKETGREAITASDWPTTNKT